MNPLRGVGSCPRKMITKVLPNKDPLLLLNFSFYSFGNSTSFVCLLLDFTVA